MKAKITMTYEYELVPCNYAPGLTPQEMLQVDKDNDAHDILDLSNWIIKYELVEETE